jgi:carboxyl-terminal processing protease
MNSRFKIGIVLVSVAISIYAFAGAMLNTPMANWFGVSAQQPVNDAGAQMRIFESVLQHIQNDYVDEPNMEKVRAGALRGLAYGLDPYSSYLTADQVKDFQAKKAANQAGIGVEVSQVSGYLYVISVIKGSPADKAGLHAGDVVEYVDTKATRDISLYDAKQLLLGADGAKVNLRVLRAGAKPQTIAVTRGTYKIPEVEVKMEEGRIGNIKVYSLEDGESKDIASRVSELNKQGVQKIVLDLRGVAAGSLTEATNVANLFIKDGTLAQVIGRENKVLRTVTADPAKFVFGGQVAVLIDLGTSGAAEVVASAMLDRQRGEVVGERSFGAGTEQQLFPLRGGDGLLLTTAKWASATGKTFLGDERANSGVKPSVEVKHPENPDPIDPEDLADQEDDQPAADSQPQQPQPTATPKPAAKPAEDIQLKKALEHLNGKAAAAKTAE